MKSSFNRNLENNYMILEEEEQELIEGYGLKMLLYNKVDSVLPCSIRTVDSVSSCHYEITSKQTMMRVFERRQIQYADLQQILSGFLSFMRSAKEYMLIMNHFILDENYIYMNVETEKLYFCYYPNHKKSVKDSFHKLTEYFLNHVDHTDTKAVAAVYELYRQTISDNYKLEEIIGNIYESKKEVYINPEISQEATKETKEEKEKSSVKPIKAKEDSIEDEKEYRENKTKSYMYYNFIGISVLIEIGSLAAVILFVVINIFHFVWSRDWFLKIMAGILTESAVLIYLIYNFYQKAKKQTAAKEDEVVFENKKEEWNTLEEVEGKEELPLMQVESSSLMEQKEAQINYGDTVLLACRPSSRRLISKRENDISWTLNQPSFLIGKMEGSVDGYIKEKTVSRIHAEIKQEGGECFLTDLNSTNGTYLNGKRLNTNETVKLTKGDEIRFAAVEYQYL